MNPLSFLSKVTVSAPEVKKPVARSSKQYQPTTADLRIWNSGAVFPSEALIAEFNLEYTAKDATDLAFGIDIIDIAEMPAIKSPERFIAMSFVDKKAAKVDLFGSTRYAEDGSPISSIADQGAVTFGKNTLLPLLQEVYGLVPNEEGFIDLNIVREMPFESPNGIYRFPKTVSTGAQKGETSYVRRENQIVYALIGVESEEEKENVQPIQDKPNTPEFDFTHGSKDHSAVLLEGAADLEETDNVIDEVLTEIPTEELKFKAAVAK